MNKGEWGITKSNNKDYPLYVVTDMGTKPKGIALIKNYHPFSDEMEANAHLIVSAVNACKAIDNEQPLMVSLFLERNIDVIRSMYIEDYRRRLQEDDSGESL